MSTTEATGVKAGTPVRFTAGRFGVMRDENVRHHDPGKVVCRGDVGVYVGPTDRREGWHVIKVDQVREEFANEDGELFQPGDGPRYCPVHRSHFEPVTENGGDAA